MNEKKMAALKLERHGAGWRYTKRVPKALQAHYLNQTHRFTTQEPDEKAARALALRWLADLEEEFQRIRATGSRFAASLPPEQLQALAVAHRSDCLRIHEEVMLQGFGGLGSTLKAEFEESVRRRLLDLQDAGQLADYSLMSGYAALLLRRFKLTLIEDSPSWLQLCHALWKAERELLEAALTRGAGGWVDTPPMPDTGIFTGKSLPATKSVADLIDWFLLRQDQAAPMHRKHKQALGLFAEVFGGRGMDSLRQADIEEFCALLCRLPPRWTKERKEGKTVFQIAAQDWPECITETTFNKTYRASLSVFLKDCAHVYGDAGFPRTLSVTRTPYTGTRKGGEDKQRALKPDELKRLYEGAEFAAFAADQEQAHCYWLPLVGLYTGARVNEVCQLNPRCDIREDGGVWFFDFTEDSDTDERVTKSVKNKSSKRRVPIHSQLLALGFLSYVEKVKELGHSLLFPKWHPKAGKASGKAREWFSDWLREIGLRDETPGKCITGFHCFRHTLMTKAANTPGLPWPIENITGHSTGGHSKDAEGYKGGELELPNKVRILELITFDVSPPRPA